MFETMYNVYNADCNAEAFNCALCDPHLAKMRDVPFSSPATMEKDYGSYWAQEEGNALNV